MNPKKVIIIGAAGRDFHNFNTYFRGNNAFKCSWPSQPLKFLTLQEESIQKN